MTTISRPSLQVWRIFIHHHPMKQSILHDMLVEKDIKKIDASYIEYNPKDFGSFRVPEITVHGRFQPPLHVNHFYTYIATAFKISEKVHILITNPYLNELDVTEASHRNSKENNPLTYDERVKIFKQFFENIGVPASRYDFKPFNITNEESWKSVLGKDVPNLVNTYGAWSEAKLSKFQSNGYKVIHSSLPKIVNISGSQIRKIIFDNTPLTEKRKALIDAGIMPEALEAVLNIFIENHSHPPITE